jgi:hypothetical protein
MIIASEELRTVRTFRSIASLARSWAHDLGALAEAAFCSGDGSGKPLFKALHGRLRAQRQWGRATTLRDRGRSIRHETGVSPSSCRASSSRCW